MRHGRLPLVWGGNGKGDGKRGERVIGGEWVYRIGMSLSEITLLTELKIPSQLIIFLLSISSRQRKGAFSPFIPVNFSSIYRDDSCRQFRKCRPNVSVELGSLKKFPFLLRIFKPLSDHRPPTVKNSLGVGSLVVIALTRQDTSTCVRSGLHPRFCDLCAVALGLG